MHFGTQKELESVSESVVRKAVSMISETGLRTRVQTVIDRRNYRDIENMCDDAYGMGANRIKFIRLLPVGKAAGDASLIIDGIEREEFFGLVDAARARYGKDELEIVLNGNFGPRKGTRGERMAAENRYCPSGKEIFAITPDNTVYGCPFLLDYPIGKYTEEDGIVIEKETLPGIRDRCIADYLY